MPELCCFYNSSWRVEMWFGSGESPRTRSLHSEPSPGVKVPNTSYSGELVPQERPFYLKLKSVLLLWVLLWFRLFSCGFLQKPSPVFQHFPFHTIPSIWLRANFSIRYNNHSAYDLQCFQGPIKISFLFKAEEKQWTFTSKEKLHI